MEPVREFLDDLKRHGHARGNLLGLLHVLIGRRIDRADGTAVANGVTWRDLAEFLKKVRWDKEAVRELGLAPSDLPPRDRERFWYVAIARSRVDSPEASNAGDQLADTLRPLGYLIGSPPR